MRGDDNLQEGIFSYISPEKRVPADHPLRAIRKMVDEILNEMSPQFAKLYSNVGRPSIAPERLLRSLLLQIFYSVRLENWVEKREAPEKLIAGRLNNGAVERTRPVYPYPILARYSGKDDPKQADSFVRVDPSQP
jgi:Tannase and feruloyl esterase